MSERQLAEMESWLIGCVNSLCECDSYLLLPEMHRDDCPYRLAATSKPEGWVSVDEITGKVPPHERILEIVGR